MIQAPKRAAEFGLAFNNRNTENPLDNIIFTLHLEHYLGISLWITPESQGQPNVEAVAAKIETVIKQRIGSRDGTCTR